MKIPPEVLTKIKAAVNIADVVGEHVVLKKTGAHWVGLCPFHSERSPSFSVSPEKGLYHCYGCKAGGDVITFVKELFGMSFPEAIQEMASRAGVDISQWMKVSAKSGEGEGGSAQDKEMQTAFKLNRFAASVFRQNLTQSKEAVEYLQSRKVSEEMLQMFYVGFSVGEWDQLVRKLQASQAPTGLAAKIGLIRPSTKLKGEYFDAFRNRVLFPILNQRGRIAGFGGRSLPGMDPDMPKYLNSSDSFIFQKSKLLFGLFQAKKHIREQDEVIIVEGYFDVIAMVEAGFKNTVATCGTSLTPEHLKLLGRLATKITVLFDADAAGQQAMERAMELGLEQGVVLRGIFLSDSTEGKKLDPDEFLHQPEGVASMQARVAAAESLLDLKIRQEVQGATQSSEKKVAAIKKIASWLSKFSDPIGKEVRVQGVSKDLSIERGILLQAMGVKEVNSFQPRNLPPPQGFPPPPPRAQRMVKTSQPRLSQTEKTLLYSLTAFDQCRAEWEWARDQLPLGFEVDELFFYQPAKNFTSNFLKKALSPPLAGGGHAQPQDYSLILSFYLSTEENPQVRSIIGEGMISHEKKVSTREIRAALSRQVALCWAQFSHKLRSAMAEAEVTKDLELQAKLMQEYLDVQRKMKEFNSFL